MKLKVAENTLKSSLLLALALVPSLAAQAAKKEAHIRADPHHYSAPRGNDPMNQMVIQSRWDWERDEGKYPAKISLHGDFEMMGRKDNSIDLDRAWIQIPVGEGPMMTFGRIHPFDVSHHYEANRPWGMAAQSHAQNRGILLGSPLAGDVFPQPVIQGWIGAHAWSDRTYKKPFQFGISATPVFIPSMGSSVSYGNPIETRASRFARQPPGFVEMNGKRYPVRYDIDTSKIAHEILQPQWMGQTYYRAENAKIKWETWVTVRRAPSVDPELETKAALDLRQNTPEVAISVKPKFPQKWTTSFTQKITPVSFSKDSSLFSSVEYQQGGKLGTEIGIDTKYFMLSHMNEYQFFKRYSPYDIEGAPYSHHLFQAEGRIPTSFATFYGGTKYHLMTRGTWVRGGVRVPLTPSLDVDSGMDVFVGDKNTYFGDWRGNDRVYLGINWRVGS